MSNIERWIRSGARRGRIGVARFFSGTGPVGCSAPASSPRTISFAKRRLTSAHLRLLSAIALFVSPIALVVPACLQQNHQPPVQETPPEQVKEAQAKIEEEDPPAEEEETSPPPDAGTPSPITQNDCNFGGVTFSDGVELTPCPDGAQGCFKFRAGEETDDVLYNFRVPEGLTYPLYVDVYLWGAGGSSPHKFDTYPGGEGNGGAGGLSVLRLKLLHPCTWFSAEVGRSIQQEGDGGSGRNGGSRLLVKSAYELSGIPTERASKELIVSGSGGEGGRTSQPNQGLPHAGATGQNGEPAMMPDGSTLLGGLAATPTSCGLHVKSSPYFPGCWDTSGWGKDCEPDEMWEPCANVDLSWGSPGRGPSGGAGFTGSYGERSPGYLGYKLSGGGGGSVNLAYPKTLPAENLSPEAQAQDVQIRSAYTLDGNRENPPNVYNILGSDEEGIQEASGGMNNKRGGQGVLYISWRNTPTVPTVAFATTLYKKAEGDSTTTTPCEGTLSSIDLKVTRDADKVGDPASVYYETKNYLNVQAEADIDYVAIPKQRLDFAIGEAEKTIAVKICRDKTNEKDEEFRVKLSDPTNLILHPSKFQTSVKIQNDDLKVRLVGGSAPESAGAVSFQLEVYDPHQTTQPTVDPLPHSVDCDYYTVDDTATASDYKKIAKTSAVNLLIPQGAPGYAGGSIQVTADSITEPNETFKLFLKSCNHATPVSTELLANPAVMTIQGP